MSKRKRFISGNKVQVAGNSFIVTIPVQWARANGIEKGEHMCWYMEEENQNELILKKGKIKPA